MRTKYLSLFLIMLVLGGCIVKKKTTYSKKKTVTVISKEGDTSNTKVVTRKKTANKTADKVVEEALQFSGTRYKFGGTTKKGMDCSGLVYVALRENNIAFPRVSYEMANEGKKIKLKQVEKGDLLFFKTSKSGKRINHVGLVVKVDGDDIRFIHATSSRGVIVSSLREGFWNHAFIKATRVL